MDKKFIGDAQDILRRLAGKKVTSLHREFRYGRKKWAKDIPWVNNDELFALGQGPVHLTVEDGFSIAFASDQTAVSIVTWQGSDNWTPQLEAAEPILIVSCDDKELSNSYWASILGARISGLAIIKATDATSKRVFRNERGLLFLMDDGRKWLVSVCLDNGKVGGTVVMKLEDLRADLREVEFLEI